MPISELLSERMEREHLPQGSERKECVSEFVREFVSEFVSEFVLVSHDVALNPAHSLSFLDVEHQQVIFHHVEYVAGQLVHVCKQGTHLE